MSDNQRLALTTTVQQWLLETGGDAVSTPHADTDEIDSLSDTNLTRRLYDACAEQLSLLCQSIAIVRSCPRRIRKTATDVVTQFGLFGRCFEHGKLEACLDDEELLQCLLKHLVRVGTTFLSSIVPPYFVAHRLRLA